MYFLLSLRPESPEDSRLGSLFNEQTFTTGDILKLKHVTTKRECILNYEMFLSHKDEDLCFLRFDVLSDYPFKL